MASCFEFRTRTQSLDMVQSTQHQKMARIARLFRSRSDPSVKKEAPPSEKVAATHRRRFVRVVRDAGPAAEAEDLDNPHVMHKYSTTYWDDRSLDDADADRPCPYTVSGHTILKKHGSVESNDGSASPKHASFSESVVIVEYDRCGQIETGAHATHTQRLNDTDDENSDCDSDVTCRVLSPVSELPPSPLGGSTVLLERCLSTDSESDQPVKKLARFVRVTTDAVIVVGKDVGDITLDAATTHQMAQPEV